MASCRQLTGEVTGQITPPFTRSVSRLLKALSVKGDLGNAEIRKEFGLKDRTHLRKFYIEPALDAGLIEYTIPDKPTSRLQKYRLTSQGRAAFDELAIEWHRKRVFKT